MKKDIADCKKEIVSTFISCLAYLKVLVMISDMFHNSTEAEDGLIQQIEETLRLFAPELLRDVEHEQKA